MIYNPNENKRVEGALVGLYQGVDSLDLFHKKPIYFTFSDESGKYEINNVNQANIPYMPLWMKIKKALLPSLKTKPLVFMKTQLR